MANNSSQLKLSLQKSDQMRAEIISIGDELLSGQTVNTNAAWMGEHLMAIGISVAKVTTINDTREAILDALTESAAISDLILITGGLGPTKDDITKSTLCEYFDDTLEPHQPTLDQIDEFFQRRGLPILKVNQQQADLPSKCEVIPNTLGTAQGMWFEKEGTIYVAMPGVPYEMIGIMSEGLLPKLMDRFVEDKIAQLNIMTVGIGESKIATEIGDIEDEIELKGVKLAYLPAPGQVKVRLVAIGPNISALNQDLEYFKTKIVSRIADHVYSEESETLEEAIGKRLLAAGATLSTAESCTGGYIAQMITSVAGSSAYFNGSIVSYSNAVKINNLGVDPAYFETVGAVSEEVVREMAAGARKRMGTDYAISTSGIAGPDGGSDEKPVGTVWIAVAGPNRTVAECFLFGKSRSRNIRVSALSGLNLLRKELLEDSAD